MDALTALLTVVAIAAGLGGVGTFLVNYKQLRVSTPSAIVRRLDALEGRVTSLQEQMNRGDRAFVSLEDDMKEVKESIKEVRAGLNKTFDRFDDALARMTTRIDDLYTRKDR